MVKLKRSGVAAVVGGLAALVAMTTGGAVASGNPLTAAHAAVPYCFGKPATIIGSSGPDVLRGKGNVSDVMWGGGGNDYLAGEDDDSLTFGDAPDFLCGGPGDDYMRGGFGNDKLSGGGGGDYLDGYYGADIHRGKAGNDRMGQGTYADADTRNDVFYGGAGNDRIQSDWGVDKVYGQGGDDDLQDWTCGGTTLNGGPGDDVITSYRESHHDVDCSDIEEPSDGVSDRVIGGGGRDSAEVDKWDYVTLVEVLTRR